MELVCEICNNARSNTSYVAREMMFGFRDEFTYFECAACGCLQISEQPRDMKKYYPEAYPSFGKVDVKKANKVKRFIKKKWTAYYLKGGRLLKNPGVPGWMCQIKGKNYGINVHSRILDVGCGTGSFLMKLHSLGFENLRGIDLYIENDLFYENGIRIHKKHLCEVVECFDLIILNHTFEHMPEPLETLGALYRLTSVNGVVMIRIPVASSFAWRKYRTNWAQLDAPRHFYLHSLKSMEILCAAVGFKIESVYFDSTVFQFMASEQYIRGITLFDRNSFLYGLKNSIFNREDYREFSKKAIEVNKLNQGDQACFYLRKVTH